MSNYWQNKHVLVTGAGGFIGSHLTESLVNEGAQVRAFVRYNSRGDPGLLRLVEAGTRSKLDIIAGDVRDSEAIRQAMKDCDCVFHLGALVSIPYSYLHPIETAETNIMGTLNVLSASRAEGIQRLVVTSSSEVYGTAQKVPIDETHPLQGQSPYSASKIGADKLAESYFCAYKVPVVTLRPFNTYGPRQSARAVIPTIITQALTQSIIHLGNLETTRDFTFANDTVNGFLKAGETPGIEGKTINLGSGTEISIGNLAQKIIQITDRAVRIEIDKDRLRPNGSEVYRLLSDNALAGRILGWKPEISLEQGLEITMKWIHDHLDLYRIGTYEF
jgi:NAD dependent epimerase/dehydratase